MCVGATPTNKQHNGEVNYIISQEVASAVEGKGKRSREDEDSETLRFESRPEEVESKCRFLWGKNIPGPKVGAFRGQYAGMDPA